MKNTIFKLFEYSYYFSLVILFILYLFPASLIGFLLYDNLSKQPDLIPNPIGTSINHLISFIYISSLAFIVRVRKKNLLAVFNFYLLPQLYLKYFTTLFQIELSSTMIYLLILWALFLHTYLFN